MTSAAIPGEEFAANSWSRSYLGLATILVALFLTIAPSEPARGLDPSRSISQAFHRVWQVPQGLPQATIFSILQTEDGYLWLGTPAGLIRFDGIRFITIADCAGVPADKLRIRDLCEDRAHQVWVATDGMGLIRYRGKEPLRYTRAQGMPSDSIVCVLPDRDGSVWAGTESGLVHVAEKLMVYATKQGMPIQDVRGISQAQDGTIWVAGAGNRACSFDGSAWTTHELSTLPAQAIARAVICARDGTVWFGTTNGLVRLKGGQESLLTTKDGLPDDSIYCLYPAQDGTLWIGTRSGFSRLNGDDISSFDAEDGLSQSNVYTIFEDHEGSLWVGTKHGLNQFNDRRTVPFTSREGLPSNNIGPLCNDAEGNIWIGTLGAGLARFDGRRFNTLVSQDGLASDTIKALARGEDNRLWVGTDRGLNCLADRHVVKTLTTADGLPSDDVTSICSTTTGELWVGTAAGVVQLQGERFVPPAGDPVAVKSPVISLASCRDGSILIATTDGLFQFVEGQVRRYPISNVAFLDVNAIYQDSQDRLYLGTQGQGLWLVDGEQITNFTTRQGLLDDDISGIVVDDEDRIWMASGSGLSHTPRLDLVSFAAGKISQVTTMPFRLTDATRSFEVQEGVQPCILKSADGRIWQSTTRGLIMVDPARLIRVLPPTPVVIEKVIVNGRPRDPEASLSLPPGSSNLAFEFTALSLVVPMRITFRYKLEGFDNDWVEAGSRRAAFYTNLSPGQYQFRVAARNVDENYWEAAQPVTFTIRPHFYQTFWFLPSCAVALCLAGLGAYRLRVRTIKEQMRAVVAERSRIARELHDTLMQGFSGVTMEMQALAARLPHSNERGTLEEIIRDAANCVRDARRSVAGLRHDPAGDSSLAAAIERAARQLTETRDFRLRLNMRNCPRRLPVDVEYNLLRIAQEAVANAVKHSGAHTIDVTLDGSGRQILLAVEDDGIGFISLDPAAGRAGHYGLIGMRERATQIGANLRIDSEEGRGTTVFVTLPLPEMPRTSEPPITHEPSKETTRS